MHWKKTKYFNFFFLISSKLWAIFWKRLAHQTELLILQSFRHLEVSLSPIDFKVPMYIQFTLYKQLIKILDRNIFTSVKKEDASFYPCFHFVNMKNTDMCSLTQTHFLIRYTFFKSARYVDKNFTYNFVQSLTQ